MVWSIVSKRSALALLMAVAAGSALTGCEFLNRYADDMHLEQHGVIDAAPENISPQRVHGGII